MNLSVHEDFRSWNRAVLRFYWLTIAMMVAFDGAAVAFSGNADAPSGLFRILHTDTVLAAGISACFLLAAEAAFRFMRKSFEFVLIPLGFLISILILLYFGDDAHGVIYVLDVPVIVSLFYFNRRITWFASAFTICGFLLLYPFLSQIRQLMDPAHLITLFCVVLGTTFIGQVIYGRGQELLEGLERAVLSEMEQFAGTVAMESASKQDHLTGLYNHITFHEYFSALLQQHRAHGMPLHLALLDLDDFKAVNDTYGHQTGDRVLRQAAEIVAETITPDDVAFRYGGEEFAVLLTGRDGEESLRIVERIRRRMEETAFPELHDAAVTFSIGFGSYAADADDGKDGLFKRVDELLYRAKRLGKNRTISDRNGGEANGHGTT